MASRSTLVRITPWKTIRPTSSERMMNSGGSLRMTPSLGARATES